MIKICGLTSASDALVAAEAGADALGFVFAPSPRQMTARAVAEITAQLPPEPLRVGVFVNATADTFAGGTIFPPGESPEDFVRAAGGAWALAHIMDSGLVVPLRSSIVRNILDFTEAAAEATALVPVAIAEAQGLKQEVSDWRSGACSTLWTKP